MFRFIISVCALLLIVLEWGAQKTVNVDVNLDVKRKVGEISSMDRNKFITIHADVYEHEWDGDNFVSDLRDDYIWLLFIKYGIWCKKSN